MGKVIPLNLKKEHYLKLAKEVLSLSETVKDDILLKIKDRDLHDKVLAGLGLKIYDSFKALVDDIEKDRSEAFHHLKTMAECFLYLLWVAQDRDKYIRSRLLMAKSYKEKIKFFGQNLGYPEKT